MQDASTYRIKDPYLKSSLIHFIADCGVPAIAENKLSVSHLIKSSNIWGLFSPGILNPSIETVSFGPFDDKTTPPNARGTVLTCPEAYTAINNALPEAKNRMQSYFLKNYSAGVTTNLFAAVLNFNAKSGTYNPTPQEYLQQAGLINLLKGPVQKYMAASSKDASMLQAIAVNQAVNATETSWETSAEVFQQTFGYLYSMVQILIYAVAPILFLFAVFPGGMKILLKRYVILLAWFPFTFIMLAIANDLILAWTQSEIGNVFTNFSGLASDSQELISAKAAKMQEVGAYIVSIVPLLAWSILEGGQYAMSHIITHSGAEKWGNQAAETATSGNISLGNESFGNVNANKFNTASQVDIGAMPVSSNVMGGDSLLKANFGGQNAVLNGAPDMFSDRGHTGVQHADNMSQSANVDMGGSYTNSNGISDTANISEGIGNTTTTGGKMDLGISAAGSRASQALLGAAAGAGLAMSVGTANAVGMDMAQGKAMSEKAYQAGLDGNDAEKSQYQQESKGFFSEAIDKMESMPWYEKATIGAALGVAAVAAFGTGIGEAGLAAGAVGAAAEGGAAELGGTALGSAAVDAGVSDGLESSVISRTEGGMGIGRALKGGAIGSALGGLAKGVSGGIDESYRGDHSSRIDNQFSSRDGLSGDTKQGYSNTHRVDEQTSITHSESGDAQWSEPNEDFYNAMGYGSGGTTPVSSLESANKSFSHGKYNIQQASGQTQDKISGLSQRGKSLTSGVKESIQNRDGINQIPRSNQQVKAGSYRV